MSNRQIFILIILSATSPIQILKEDEDTCIMYIFSVYILLKSICSHIINSDEIFCEYAWYFHAKICEGGIVWKIESM